MKLSEEAIHLTYCTNIHASSGWEGVRANLARYAPPLKARFSPDKPFGIGLRLSGVESCEGLEGTRLEDFRAWLEAEGLYVFTMNGFPYGPFHGQAVKAEVHAPDWRSEERVAYTLRLVEMLAYLLPEGTEGGISTSPLSYKAWVNADDPALWETLTKNVVRVAEALVRVKETQGKTIHLDIEPEPDGLLGTNAELVSFYKDWLLTEGAASLARRLGGTEDEARVRLLEHIQVCFDTCHAAVAFEEPAAVLAEFAEVGIKVGKVQISSALRVPLPDGDRDETAQRLLPFAESTYLHQVVQRNHDGSFTQYPDLSEALEYIQNPAAAEWRIHFHVPTFAEGYGELGSTQETISETFKLLRERPFTNHLEIETYTWEVLPPGLKTDLGESIAREYEWVLREL